MKKILITGANSYIGTSFENYIKNFDDYTVDTLDMISPEWRDFDFSKYDTVFHVAGIAHIKETEENSDLYYKVNTDLTFETAKRAKESGVSHFIFLSSMSVYGMNVGIITKDTSPTPKSNYGKSKLMAESRLKTLSDENFKVAIIRPPMVYGKGCKGNFQSIIKIVKRSPVFPKVKNNRSLIYIDNLSEFVKLCIDQNLGGLYFPQNKEYVQTTDIAVSAAKILGKKIYLSSFIGLGIKLSMPFLGISQKAFGSLIYKDTEDFGFCYCTYDNENSIKKSI